MCDDVPAFTEASVTLVIGIVRKFFMMVGFSGAFSSRAGMCALSRLLGAEQNQLGTASEVELLRMTSIHTTYHVREMRAVVTTPSFGHCSRS